MDKNSKAEKQAVTPGLENEGEGNKTAARRYDDATEKFVESGKVDEAAREAKKAIDGPEGEELRRAEKEAKGRASDVEKSG